MKIIVADDHALFRDGLRHVLQQFGPDVVLIEAADHPALLACADTHPDADLALVDLNMPGAEPFAALSALLAAHPTLPVVVLSASENTADMHRALEIGALGYIPKRESANIMLSALRLVLTGGIYIPPALMQRHLPASGKPRAEPGSLTSRQLDVLRRLVNGKSNKDIGRELKLSEATVKAHISAIFRALNVSNRTQATREAQRLGLLDTKP